MFYSHLQTATGQPVAVAAAGSSRFDRLQRCEPTATAIAVHDDAEVTGCVLDSEKRRQNAHVAYVNLKDRSCSVSTAYSNLGQVSNPLCA